jgi:hypothetical protein
MTELLLIFNVVFAYLCWKWSQECFEDEGRQYVGWLYLFLSAWNGASAAAMLF